MSNVDQHDAGTPTWFDLMTPDLEGAQTFYGELFGWTFIKGTAETMYYTMCQKNGRNAAGMGKRPEDAPYPTSWSVYFDTRDADASATKVREFGGQVMMGPMDVMEAGRMLVCVDPTGAVFGFWQGRNHKGAQVVDEHGAMTWCEVATRESEKAAAFYSKALDVEARKMAMEMPGMTYYTLHKGEKAVSGIMQMNEQWDASIPPHWMPYFAVDSAEGACEKIKALGGKVMHGPFDTTYGRIAVVADPYGAPFSIIKLSDAAMAA
ncbi:VOC family protein [Polyangium sp. 6x1]|uniref:VOC family protein n=1 Tax=Polyangium sp. 6x1 TaxID=3042689 RepID=UPI002482CE1C|nr:VOC family protein [Polyangium sp. 6x1]MDI1445293.1 VOC family protein [Polyangium sp. 6x1]